MNNNQPVVLAAGFDVFLNTLIDWDVKLGFLEKADIFPTFHNKKDGFGLKIYINKCKASYYGVVDYSSNVLFGAWFFHVKRVPKYPKLPQSPEVQNTESPGKHRSSYL